MNLHKTLKKVYKAGYFHSFELTSNSLTFKDCFNNMYVLKQGKKFFYFRIGHVEQWQERKPTYESDYNSIGLVDCALFVDHVKIETTTNPDYVLRLAQSYLFATI